MQSPRFMFCSVARHVGQWFTPQTIDVRVHKILSAIDEQILGETNLDPVLKALETSKHDLFCCFRKYTSSVSAAQALTLKVQNLCLGKQQFLARSTTLVAKPFGILVDPANGCNLACPGCVHSHTARERGLFDWKPAMLSESRMSALLARFGPCAIQTLFCNYGEPLLNPNTPKFARLAKSYLMQTVLSTNLALPHFDADAYVRSGLDYMILSIDGATQAVYERFRKKGKIQIVFDNIQKLVEARLRTGKRTPVLCWQYLAFDHNAHEIPHAIETARCLGLDVFQIASRRPARYDCTVHSGIQSRLRTKARR